MLKPDAHIPQLREEVDVDSLQVDAFERFICGFFDGRRTAEEIAEQAGTSAAHVIDLARRLQAEAMLRAPRAAAESEPAEEGDADIHQALEEGIALPIELQKQVLKRFHAAGARNHYEVLEIARDAERAQVKKQYFALAKRFHTDRYYGKELGGFRGKLEKVFKEITDAYEVLSRAKPREEYDAYLKAQDRLLGISQELEQGKREAERLSSAPEEEVSTLKSDNFVGSYREDTPASPSPPPASPPPPSLLSEDERRARAQELLRRRMRRGSSGAIARPTTPLPTASTPTTPPPSPSAPLASTPRTDVQRRADTLRGLQGALKGMSAASSPAARHVASGRAAFHRGDYVSAVNALRLALATDESVQGAREILREAEAKLAQELADTYGSQAKYEERARNWAGAGRSWLKVAEGRPGEDEPLLNAVRCFLSAGEELKLAAQAAMELIQRNPTAAHYVLLARVYEAASMHASAKSAIAEALQRDPSHVPAQRLQKELE